MNCFVCKNDIGEQELQQPIYYERQVKPAIISTDHFRSLNSQGIDEETVRRVCEWLYHGKISVEHAHEANALNLMKHRFEESLEKIKALKGVE